MEMESTVLNHPARFVTEECDGLGHADAASYTRAFTRGRRENFHVLSPLLPRRLRDDFAAVYAFCRRADDLADDEGGPDASLPLLQWWERELRDCFDGRPRHPVLVALRETVRRHDLPIEPFLDLLHAFRQDQAVNRYRTWDDLLNYCRRSANPVGRLVLMLCGERDEARFALADKTCTALQLVNFWQDVRRDVLERGRVYVPQEEGLRHGLDVEALAHAIGQGRGEIGTAQRAAFRGTLRDLAARTEALLDEGRLLWPLLGQDVRPVIRLFTLGGDAVLRKIRRMNYDTWRARPRVGPAGKGWLLLRAWVASKGDRA